MEDKIEKTSLDKKTKPKTVKKKFNLKKLLFFFIVFLVLALIGIFIYLGFTVSLESIQYKYRVFTIEKKILYLIEENKQINILEKYYSESENITLNTAIEDLSYSIEKNCKFFKINDNFLIALINGESRFAKFARSKIEIKDEKGKLIREDSALGFCQIYLTVWQDIIPIDADILFNSYENTYWGCYVLRHYLNKNNGDKFSALVNYNGGYKRSDEKYTTINTKTFIYISRILNDETKLNNYNLEFNLIEFLRFYFK
jgi:hypothetical protein